LSTTEPAQPPEADVPREAPPPAPRRSARWRLALASLGGGLLLAVSALIGTAGWAVGSEAGSTWLLTRLTGVLPWLQVTAPRGALLGDFSAQRVQINLSGHAGAGDRVVITELSWRALAVRPSDVPSLWAHLRFAELHAARVDVLITPTPGPMKPPADLALPLQLDVDDLRIAALHVSGLGDELLRDLHARLQLGAAFGQQHRVDDLRVGWQQWQASGTAHIDIHGPMAVQARIALSPLAPPSGATAKKTEPVAASAAPSAAAAAAIDPSGWQARLTLDGPLAAAALHATVQSAATGTRAAQSLEAQAGLRPFADWPLASLQLHTQAFDVSVLHRQAPVTSLSGQAMVQSQALDQPISAHIDLTNDAAGRWSDGRLPLRALKADVLSRADDRSTLELKLFDAVLGSQEQAAGRITGAGVWNALRSTLELSLNALQPAQLDARAPAMLLNGPLSLVAHHPLGDAQATPADGAPQLDVKLDLNGVPSAALGPKRLKTAAQAVRLKLAASVSARHIELRTAQALAHGASATLSGVADRAGSSADWQLKGRGALVDFDPRVWWPGTGDSPWRRQSTRLNASANFDVRLPADAAASAIQGNAQVHLASSVLAGVPIEGSGQIQRADARRVDARVDLNLAGNRLQGQGRLATNGAAGRNDHWDVTLDAPALAAVTPLWQLLRPADEPGAPPARLAGALSASARIDGRWPDLTLQGEAHASELRIDETAVQQAQLRWRAGTADDAVIDVTASVSHVKLLQATTSRRSPGGSAMAEPTLDSASLGITGTTADHHIELRARLLAQPPAWTEALQPAIARQPDSGVLMQAHGGLIRRGGEPLAGWRGSVTRLQLGVGNAAVSPWLAMRDVQLEAGWSGGPAQLDVVPGRAEVLGATLRWSSLSWRAGGSGPGAAPGRANVQMSIDPLPIATVLARLQPSFGWGGDLAVGARIDVHSEGRLAAEIVIERSGGDLTVTDEVGTQALGLRNLRLALGAQDGVWTFSPYLSGQTLGVLAGAVVVRTTPEALWPEPQASLEGAMELEVANLGAWGPWVPAGWRLGGQLQTSALFGGRFGAPQFNGNVRGHALGARNFVEGVNVSDGEVAISLDGDRAVIERFTARAGTGTLDITGSALLGAQPSAKLQIQAEHFTLLGRVDRRIVASGQAQLGLSGDALDLHGAFTIDEGLIDFTRSDAPALGADVQVVRASAAPTAPVAAPDPTAPARSVALDVKLNLGKKLQLRGRGLETGLRGEVQLSAPGGHLAINGTVSAVDGTYAAYGKKLTIDRGLISFNGPPENPRLNIEATRPLTDLRVGVQVTGTAMNPRVRLFSEPELPEIDKLSWLVLGRASDGLGRGDTALLQTAALALLSGEGESYTDQLTRAIGIDELSVKQGEGDVRDTVISLGKQLSRRWYVGYERGLNATGGNWQLIYRIAQSFTLRAQSGLDNSLDVIWSWRWN
jgi:translocation and assembly module TamB